MWDIDDYNVLTLVLTYVTKSAIIFRMPCFKSIALTNVKFFL